LIADQDGFSVRQHLAFAGVLFAESLAAPLSARRVRLVAALLDAVPDRLWASGGGDGEDILEFRYKVGQQCPALGVLAALGEETAQLVVEAVEVPLADYRELGIADVMVSVYNKHTVQRVRIVAPDGHRLLAHDVLRSALEWWQQSGLVGAS
jgi:hypothetical protein